VALGVSWPRGFLHVASSPLASWLALAAHHKKRHTEKSALESNLGLRQYAPMQMQNNKKQDVAQAQTDSEALIPDLCQGRAVLWLILFSEALVLVLILLSSNVLSFQWGDFALLSFYVQWVVLITAACLCRIRLHVKHLSLNQLLVMTFATMMAVNLTISLCTQFGLNRFMDMGLDWQWILRNQIISAVVALLLLHYFYAQLQWRLQSRSELQARVQALQSRIRPHFLFNSMNIIASLIHVDPDKAEQAVEDLSELFRASLKEAGVEVSLEQELELCKKYVHIEQLRLGERLNVNWQVEAKQESPIPMLTLQPLLENAILHGIQPLAKGGEIDVSIRQTHHGIFIEVSNPHPQQVMNERHERGNKMALENIRHRLAALYGEQVTMWSGTESRNGDVLYVTRIQYPLTGKL